jgi:AraC family transcriptional regulator, regulatory protein of adaptative response / methylated-DNA-[protein]-cysteine methyltransferase
MENYTRIAKAIEYLHINYKEQPSLETVAKQVQLSPFHFQRMFTQWAGVSPKKFLQYISVQHAKALLQDQYTIAGATFETGLSATSRLHDLFIHIEGMTPGEYKNGGAGLQIGYWFSTTPFGEIIIATTEKGICNLFFIEDKDAALLELMRMWPAASIKSIMPPESFYVSEIFANPKKVAGKLSLHLKGTAFQIRVWEALLRIPFGGITAYSHISESMQLPGAARAVGSAIAANPVAFLIPCHRVIKSTGLIGEYHWGTTRKTAIIGWESSKVYGE